MSGELKELSFFADPDIDKLAALVFDLAAQLHQERQRRMALETVLTRSASVDPEALKALAGDAAFTADARAALDAAQARLFDILAERGDRRTPLRAGSRSVPQASRGG
ncbi:hypothetical protein RDV64_21290 [Acuticoccus sp. MNP-M23]|uniref:hypothetical protein n=1 Tax=Acuticoccus sp. MNP-M23 TaxID=3072793 RepID=UPI002814A5B0|nr:hypothetical protein [Acuticoccus sp. MNP-M23]WMS42566.1 hypothetical protein RDV64_21290 [Acuticoccus sp. MNP-M23]